MSEITYEDKVDIQDFPLVANINKIRAEDMNEIKSSVNALYTSNIAEYYMASNATATTISLSNIFYKVAGPSTEGPFVERFTITDNRATYTGTLHGYYKVSAILTVTGGNNKTVRVRIGKNGATAASSEIQVVTSGAGRADAIPVQGVVQLANGDYIEIFIANGTDATNFTVTFMNVIITRLN